MYSAIFSRTYPLTNASDVLAAVVADGYRGMQFNLLSAGLPSLPDQLPDDLVEKIGERARASNLRLAALSGTYNMAHPDLEARAALRRGFRNVVEAARRMGTPVVTLCTGSRDPKDMWRHHPDNRSVAAWTDFRGELDFALGLAADAGIKLAVEPEPGNIVNDAEAARRLLDEVASPLLGIVLDAANLLSPETLPMQHNVIAKAMHLLGNSLLLAHAKDIDASGNVTPAGEGAVDLSYFVAALCAAGYDGALIGHGFTAEKAADVSRVLDGLDRGGTMIAGEFRTEDGCLLAYEDSGEGIPVLWQHGLGADRKQPAEVFPSLPGIRRLTLECRGHGRSELGDRTRLSIATFEADVLAFLDHLNIERAIAGGISLGAAIAMRFAALHPERVAALILARPAWVAGPSASTMAAYLEIAELLERFGAAEGARRFEYSQGLAAVAAVSPDNAASLKGFFSRPNPESTIALLSAIPKDSPGIGARAIATIAAPTLIIGNHHDYVHPLTYAERLKQLLPGATLRVITAKSTNKDLYRLDFKESLSRS